MAAPAAISSALLALAVYLGPIAPARQAPAAADLPACVLQGRNYLCNKPNAIAALAAAHTVALVSQPANHASDAALASLARSLDKAVLPGDKADGADLTLRLTPIEPAGVSVGMGTTNLAMLNLFAATPGNPIGRLLWSETYNGNPDMPWPSVVNALTRQFKAHLDIK